MQKQYNNIKWANTETDFITFEINHIHIIIILKPIPKRYTNFTINSAFFEEDSLM